MSVTQVMIIFASIQVLTASLYYFAVPETLSNAGWEVDVRIANKSIIKSLNINRVSLFFHTEDQKVGVWGTPDGEFNW